MAATIATMAMLNFKSLSINAPHNLNTSKQTLKPISLLSLRELPRRFNSCKSSNKSNVTTSLPEIALASAIFSTLSSCEPALAAQQIAEIAEGDNRGLALLLPIIPAILWVLYNILQPALNQINRMRSDKGIVVGLGLCGLAASSFFYVPSASAGEIAMIGEASSDNRSLLMLFVVAPALAWVLYNILQPALNQINRMRSG